MTDAKFKLEDILNKKKALPQILDLTNTRIETEEDFKACIEKIPDYRIKPEPVINQGLKKEANLFNSDVESSRFFLLL